MRVGFDLRYASNEDFLKRGVGRYAFSLLSAMLNCDNSTEFSLLLTPSVKEEYIKNISNRSRVKVIIDDEPNPISKVGFLKQYVAFPLRISKFDVDVWHFSFSEIAPPWLKKPFVVTLHDLAPLVYQPRYMGMKQKLFHQQQQQIYNNASSVIAISNHSKRELVDY